MRYFWALLTYVTVIVVGVASCGGNGGTGTGFSGTPSGGVGGQTTTGTGSNGGSLSIGAGGSTGVGIMLNDAGNGDGGTCSAYKGDCATQKLELRHGRRRLRQRPQLRHLHRQR